MALLTEKQDIRVQEVLLFHFILSMASAHTQ